MRFGNTPFRFEILFTAKVKTESGSRKAILNAAKKTLLSLPRKVLFEKLHSKKIYSLSVSLVGETLMRRLNGQYRQKHRSTDVLSFSRLEGKRSPHPDIGDVVICLKVARRQAKALGFTLNEELQRLTVHGVLHCFGYDHELSAREEKRMFALQEKIIRDL